MADETAGPRDRSEEEPPTQVLTAEEGELFEGDERLLFTGHEVSTILFELGGAVSGVFLREDPQKVMPTEAVTKAIRQWTGASGSTWERAEDAHREAQEALAKGRAEAIHAIEGMQAQIDGFMATTAEKGTDAEHAAYYESHRVVSEGLRAFKEPEEAVDGTTAAGPVPSELLSGPDIFRRKAQNCRLAASLDADPIGVEGFYEAADWFERQANGEDPEGPYKEGGRNRLFEFNAVKPPQVIALTADRSAYPDSIAELAHAAVVIDASGVVIKDRNGLAGRPASRAEALEAQPVFPPGEAEKRQEELADVSRPSKETRSAWGAEVERLAESPVDVPDGFVAWLALVVAVVALVISIAAVVSG